MLSPLVVFLTLNQNLTELTISIVVFLATLSLFTHSMLFGLSEKYRFTCEVVAYRKQLEYSPTHALLFADFIATRYGLSVSREQALKALLNI